MAEKKWCPECEKEVELTDENPNHCPTCKLNLTAIYERDRHERALEKLKKHNPVKVTATKVTKKDDDPFSFSL